MQPGSECKDGSRSPPIAGLGAPPGCALFDLQTRRAHSCECPRAGSRHRAQGHEIRVRMRTSTSAAGRALSIGPPGRSVSPDNEEPPVAVGTRTGT